MSTEHFLLLTDIVDSTALVERLGDEAAAALWQQHDQLARALLRDWRGREIDKSDGFLLLFASVGDALGFAQHYHRALRRLEPPLAARAGLHCGSVALRENAADDVARGAKPVELEGIAKPIAARIMSIALAGQTLLSAQARAALGDGGPRCPSHGHWRIKGLAEPIELFEAGGDEAPFTPPPDTAKAYRVIWRDEGWLPLHALRHSLPAERDSFVGRRSELRALAQRFDEGARLVSLLGIGGTGKTRLALRYARGWLGDYPGGAWFCDLSQARTQDGIVHAVAQGLDVPLGKADPVLQLGAAIAGRGDCLLILDNFEQVAKLAEATLGAWLERAGAARFLVTTREVLGIVGEQTFALDPLPPDEAVALFERRAAACEGYRPTPEDSAAIRPLVALMDGLPLAIELAAPRVRVMPPRVLLERMNERFKLLASTGGRRDRQATLRATLDWSWELLSEAERSALAQLSVFQGGFTLAAAEAVVDLAALDAPRWIGDMVQLLIEKSLVRPRGGERFDLLLSVQAYAAQRLAEAGAQGNARRRHWLYYAALDEFAATANRCVDLENLMAACQRAASNSQAAAAVNALALAWAALKLTGPVQAALQLVEQVQSIDGMTPQQQAALRWVAANACYRLGRSAEAIDHCQRGLALAEAAADQRLRVRLHCTIADVLTHGSDPAAARRHLEQAQAIVRELGDDQLHYTVLNGLGTLALANSRFDEARQDYEAALKVAQRLGHRRWEGGLLGNLGIVAHAMARIDDAAAFYRAALQATEETGDRPWVANTHCNLGLLLCERGELEAALAEAQQALSMARELGASRLEASVLCNIGLVHKARSAHEPARAQFDAAARLATQLGDLRLQAQCRRQLGQSLAMQQRFDAAGTELERALELAVQIEDQNEAALVRCELARALRMQGADGPAAQQLQLAAEAARAADPHARSTIEAAIADAAAAVPMPLGASA